MKNEWNFYDNNITAIALKCSQTIKSPIYNLKINASEIFARDIRFESMCDVLERQTTEINE